MKRSIALLLACCGCMSKPQTSTETNAIPYELKHVDKQIVVFDAQMKPQNSISTTNDQRQTWIVSGRIRNQTQWFVDTVWIEIHISDKKTGNELDSTVIKMEDLRIPPNDGVVAFSQTARINPPATGWGWTYAVINSLTEPVYDDIKQQ